MLFLISIAPFFTVFSWSFFRSFKNLLAADLGCFDFRRSLIAFCIKGSVGRVARIFLAEDFVESKRKALIPALATFSAPWIFTDFISPSILLNFLLTFFSIRVLVDLSIKICRILYKRRIVLNIG